MTEQYRVEWRMANGAKLVRLVRGTSTESVQRAASTESYYRPIFRRANMFTRSTSAHEYMDRFPVPAEIKVQSIREIELLGA